MAQDGGKSFEVRHRSPLFLAAVYRCSHRNVELGPEEATRGDVINFPRSGFYLKHTSGRADAVDATQIVFFEAGEPFRTSHPNGCLDHGRSLSIRRDALLEIVRRFDPAVEERGRPFAHEVARSDAGLELAQELFFQALEHAVPGDTLELDEGALDLAAASVERAYAGRGVATATTRRHGARARRAHRELAAGVRARLAADPCRATGLEELAREHATSSFHLSRVFRAETGFGLAEYRTSLRLSLALERLADAADLTALALGLGFASHSHFTSAFRARFATTPSALRRTARRARIEDARARLRERRPRG